MVGQEREQANNGTLNTRPFRCLFSRQRARHQECGVVRRPSCGHRCESSTLKTGHFTDADSGIKKCRTDGRVKPTALSMSDGMSFKVEGEREFGGETMISLSQGGRFLG